MKKILLSIILVNFNSYPYLKDCLKSVGKSTFSKDKYEIIVIDNASHDGITDKIQSDYPEVRLIINRVNTGFSKANNQAIKIARGKYILLLNPDTLLFPKTLTSVIDFMEKNPDAGIATGKVELNSGLLDDSCHRGFPTPWNSLCQFTGLSRIFPNSSFFNGYHMGYKNLDIVHEIDCCSGAFMFIRKKAGDSVGWLDEDYFWYGEDIDFCYKVKQKGWKIYYIPASRIIHHKGISSGIKSHTKDISLATSKIKLDATKSRFEVMRIFYKKHYTGKYPGFVTGLIMTGITFKEILTIMKFKHFKSL